MGLRRARKPSTPANNRPARAHLRVGGDLGHQRLVDGEAVVRHLRRQLLLHRVRDVVLFGSPPGDFSGENGGNKTKGGPSKAEKNTMASCSSCGPSAFGVTRCSEACAPWNCVSEPDFMSAFHRRCHIGGKHCLILSSHCLHLNGLSRKMQDSNQNQPPNKKQKEEDKKKKKKNEPTMSAISTPPIGGFPPVPFEGMENRAVPVATRLLLLEGLVQGHLRNEGASVAGSAGPETWRWEFGEMASFPG